MNLGGLKDKIGDLKQGINTDELKGKGLEKINEMLDALNDGIPKIKALGFSVKDFRIGQGLIPDVMIKIAGEIDAINPDKLQEIIDQYPDEKILTVILKALQTSSHMKDRLSALDFKGLEAEVMLGIPPSIAINFME